ncbi:MAG: hypothetical protein HY059_17280 [Proteobacteria bacterium]|nr:hypothetical protein [Pseudomonadota bacterium]
MSERSPAIVYTTGIVEVAARRGREDALAALLIEVGGLAMPGPGRMTTSGTMTALWIAPATALLLLAAKNVSKVVATVPSDIAATNDQSGGYTAIKIASPGCLGWLPRICRLDLAALHPGCVARTVMAQMAVILWRNSEGGFDFLVPSTLAEAFSDALEHAGR